MSKHVSQDGPALVVDAAQLAGVDSSLSTMCTIPGSRMFEISDALKAYRKAHPDGTTYDASQGDGGASLPGVPGIYFSDFGKRWIHFSYALLPELTRGATVRLWEALGSI